MRESSKTTIYETKATYAGEIMENLEAGLEAFREIIEVLK